VVEPGYVATEFNAPLIEGGFEPQLLAKVPTRRAVTPESVAQAVLFAAGNPDVTGAVLRVDGGQTAKL
jgi:NAD(P)-dependent dehydrogenase (short-subunit alcohol dehydrogenase family)